VMVRPLMSVIFTFLAGRSRGSPSLFSTVSTGWFVEVCENVITVAVMKTENTNAIILRSMEDNKNPMRFPRKAKNKNYKRLIDFADY